jgi:2-polyprenyl-3-methyl-5-hydroxy-6-metoxy-1,4-benzoquinol methylase
MTDASTDPTDELPTVAVPRREGGSMLAISLAAAIALTVPDDSDQQRFWNEWNATHRRVEQVSSLDPATARRRDTALGWIEQLGISRPRILDLGCSTGWLTAHLAQYGDVVGIDLSNAAIRTARELHPNIEFECANFLKSSFVTETFDIVVAVDVMSCVADQRAFIDGIRRVLRPGGYVYIATPNRFVYERRDDVAPQGAGQIRHWNYPGEVRRLLKDGFHIRRFTTLLPEGHRGILRAVNSYKLNGILDRIVGHTLVTRAKERVGLGQTIAVLAERARDARHSALQRA